MIVFFDLNIGPIVLPIKKPKFDESRYPIMKKINKILIKMNSRSKYFFHNFDIRIFFRFFLSLISNLIFKNFIFFL